MAGSHAYHYSAFDKTRPKPKWLCKRGLANKVSWRYWQKIWNAQPVWADVEKIKAVYAEAARRRALGEDVVVDHIYPLNGDLICGFHIHTNLQIITRKENARKSNHTWPGHPFEQAQLF